MSNAKTSRRQFVQLAGGLALTLRHGLLPAQTATGVAHPSERPDRAAAAVEDAVLRIEWAANLHSRISRKEGRDWVPMTAWGPSEYLLDGDDRSGEARHIADFAIQHQGQAGVEDAHGAGTRLTLSGKSADGVEKTLQVTLYERHPGIALVRVSYRNTAARILSFRSWTNGDTRVLAAGTRTPQFWCYSGATYEDRRDWVQPVAPGFAQDNFLGMEASDYGGGTPIVDVWRRDGGLAVGHVETRPRQLSLPVQGRRGEVRVAVCGRERRYLKSGERFDTPQTFVAVHDGDYFAALNRYRLLMSERGMTPAVPPAPAYDAIWCAWGYERSCTTELIEGTLPKVKELGLEWAVIDDGWQAMIGDWNPHRAKYPNGDADLRGLVASIRAGGLKPRLWYSPLSAAPGSDLLHDHADMLLLDKEGAVQKISWWNSFYLCPAYAPTVQYTLALIKKFIGEWGFAGLKIDGQHLNGVAPCYNPAHRHADPKESTEKLQDFFAAIYETALQVDPEAVIELCPCGTSYSFFNFRSFNQAPASDPESSWQVRHKGKTLKALMGPSAAFAGDHVELSDGHDDFASTVGVGGIVSTKFTWPIDPKPKDSFLLTPDKERLWRKWIALYNEHQLPRGIYRGELYDIGFDKPETHVVERSGRLYYAFYGRNFSGPVILRGLAAGRYRVRDYFNDRQMGEVAATHNRLQLAFDRFLLPRGDTRLMLEPADSNLLIEERRRRICDLLREQGRVTVEALATRFGTSQVTIRADLSALDSLGALTRTHGGALRRAEDMDQPLGVKQLQHHAEKVRIAVAACALIREGETIILDSGTTTAEIARCMRTVEFKSVNVITNALNVAALLMDVPSVRLIMPGGILRRESNSLSGHMADAAMANLQADRLYLGADGLDPEIGVMTPHLPEAELNAQMIRMSRQVVVVADSSKLMRRNISLIAKVEQIHMLITDRAAPAQTVDELRQRGVEVMLV